jgi:translation initiation factor 6 (eIF-6)
VGVYDSMEFVMGGVCCGQEGSTDDYDNTTTTMDFVEVDEVDRLLDAVTRSRRVSVVATLIERKRRLDHLLSLANSTGVLLPTVEEVRSHTQCTQRTRTHHRTRTHTRLI